MNNNTPDRDLLAFLEVLAGEYAGETDTRRSWQQSGDRAPSRLRVDALDFEFRSLVA